MRDLLTEEEITALWRLDWTATTLWSVLQAAARLGAERARERAARVCDHLSTRAGTADDCAEAIRRGKGE